MEERNPLVGLPGVDFEAGQSGRAFTAVSPGGVEGKEVMPEIFGLWRRSPVGLQLRRRLRITLPGQAFEVVAKRGAVRLWRGKSEVFGREID